MFADRRSTTERWTSGALTALVAGGLGWALLAGLHVRPASDLANALKVFGVAPEPPPPPVEHVVPQRQVRSSRSGKASAPNLRSKATELAAPVPVVAPVVPPPPIVVAPEPGVGVQASTGAAPVAGPGTGAGGSGNGTGSGGYGDGDGAGGERDRSAPPRERKGHLNLYGANFPEGVSARVTVRYFVEVDGRASACTVVKSSGIAVIDQVTCRSIRDSFRFSPARDEDGEPTGAWLISNYDWDVPAERER